MDNFSKTQTPTRTGSGETKKGKKDEKNSYFSPRKKENVLLELTNGGTVDDDEKSLETIRSQRTWKKRGSQTGVEKEEIEVKMESRNEEGGSKNGRKMERWKWTGMDGKWTENGRGEEDVKMESRDEEGGDAKMKVQCTLYYSERKVYCSKRDGGTR